MPHLPVSSMTGTVVPPRVMLLTYTEFAMFLMGKLERFPKLDPVERFEGV